MAYRKRGTQPYAVPLRPPAFHGFVTIRAWLDGALLLASLRYLGAAAEPLEPFEGWLLSTSDPARDEAVRRLTPELAHGVVTIGDFVGLLRITCGANTFLAMRTDFQVSPRYSEPAVVLVGPTLEDTLNLAHNLKQACDAILARTRLRVFGAAAPVHSPRIVPEEELILAESIKGPLLQYLDRFWRASSLLTRLHIAPNRGVLLAGPPGTGKTHILRHILARYPDVPAYLYTQEASACLGRSDFHAMLQDLAYGDTPAMVLIEDIDRMFETGDVTPHFLLNVIDGLLQLERPVLWLATSNDPSDLQPNILDRPGRFDRIFILDLPDRQHRASLFSLYSAWPISTSALERLSERSAGLAPTHIRETCYAAAIAACDQAGTYEGTLELELDRIIEQHRRSQRYGLGLDPKRPTGFSRAGDA